MSIVCKICGRPLKNINSIITGVGPVCGGGGYHAPKKTKRRKAEEGAGLFDNHAEFIIEAETPEYIFIVDSGHGSGKKTITNDAQYVVSALYDLIDNFQNKRIFYFDSGGCIDEIIHNGNRFIQFKAGHEGVTL